MEEIRSKVDNETIYKVFDSKITISRDGDVMHIAYKNFDNMVKRFIPEIQAELKEIRDGERAQRCKHCDKKFSAERKKKFCSVECRKAAEAKRKKEARGTAVRKRGGGYPDAVTEINAKAREMKLSYGQYQALKYKEQGAW